ncbi:MAG: SH3 domain-containing protein, partial [Thermomicrobiales bacterium]|nr:SH3 domain-containing protein [Thermomicrobiales bacterium]
ARWFTQPVARRTILKAAAALTAMTSAQPLLSSPQTKAQESLIATPVTRSGYFSESLSGDGFSLASEEPHLFRAEFPFSALGAHWAAEAPENSFAVVELSYDGATWSEPFELHESHDGHEDDIDGRHFTHLLPSDGHQFVRYTSYSPSGGFYELPDLVFTYIDAFDGPTMNEETVELAAVKPPIISRNAWGADEKLRYEDQDPDEDEINPPRYETWKHAVIHHSVTTNGADPYTTMRSIYYYHAITRGWGDIGYNFLVDHRGNVFEGRFGGENVKGIHSGVFNNGSCGICCMGTFETVDVTASAQSALISIVAWVIRNFDPYEEKYLQGNLLPTIFGHRNISQTSCPGDALYNDLPFIRDAVAQVLGTGQNPGNPGDLRNGQAVRIVTSGANVRSGPGTNFSVIRTLASGTSGTIDGGPVAAHGYSWYVVKTSAGSGWMATINFETVAKAAGAFKKGDTVQTTGTLTLRSAAGTNKAVLANMAAGTTLKITYAYNKANGYEWYKVDGPYGAGWAAGAFLAKVKPKGEFSKGQRVVVNTDTLTMRASAGTSKAVVATLPRGTALTITYAYNSANGYEWYQVTGSYGKGWVAGAFLRLSSGTSTPAPSGPKQIKVDFTVYTNDTQVNMRSAPTTSGTVLHRVAKNSKFKVIDGPRTADGYTWWRVNNNTYGSGWIAANFLERR